jgi:hypothetical protein
MSESREPAPLFERVDALARERAEEARRAQEEVPVLTEVLDGTPPTLLEAGAQALAEEIEREVVRRIMPELHDIVRRAVREAVLQAFAGAGRPGRE